MGWPEYTLLALYLLGLGIALGKDGEPKEGKHSFWVSLFCTGLAVGLLWAGGFFQ